MNDVFMRLPLLFLILEVWFGVAAEIPEINPGVLPIGTGPRTRYFTNDRSQVFDQIPDPSKYVEIDGSLLALSAGPQYWDFRIGPTNSVETVEVVNANSLPDVLQIAFPGATHGLHYLNDGSSSGESWELYTRISNSRNYLGFKTGFDSPVVFLTQNLDLPGRITNGMNWSRSTSFDSIPNGTFALANDFEASSQVDGYGEIALPVLGNFDSLRVHELHTWAISFLGSPIPLYYIHTYYWIVPGLGKVVEIIFPPSFLPDELPSSAASFTRAFAAEDDPKRFNSGHISSISYRDGRIDLDWISNLQNRTYVLQRRLDSVTGSWNSVEATSRTQGRYPVSKGARDEFFQVLMIDSSKY